MAPPSITENEPPIPASNMKTTTADTTVPTVTTTESMDGKGESQSQQKSKKNDAIDNAVDEIISWENSYVAPPLISGSMVWGFGIFIFVLAMIWPPLILFATFFASMLVPYCFRITDEASHRRSILQQFDKDDQISSHRREIPDDVRLETRYWTNSRGLLLYTATMTPVNEPIKAVVGFCHGYTDHPSHTKRRELMYFVQHGIAVVMIEYEGHGRSDGQLGLIRNWNHMVEDVHTFFQEVASTVFPNKKFFLMGESMGGAVAFSIIRDNPNTYAGVVFQCPMCKIADDMLPPDWVVDLCRKITGPTGVVSPLGYLPIAPAKGNLQRLTFKLHKKRAICTRTPAVFGRRPRLASARELIHGDSDRVTDPELSKSLYKEARSKDKTIHLYEGMWHALTAGEPDENIERVLNDATRWILERAEKKEQ